MASTKVHNDAISFDVPTNGCLAVYRTVRTHLIYFGPSFLSWTANKLDKLDGRSLGC